MILPVMYRFQAEKYVIRWVMIGHMEGKEKNNIIRTCQNTLNKYAVRNFYHNSYLPESNVLDGFCQFCSCSTAFVSAFACFYIYLLYYINL